MFLFTDICIKIISGTQDGLIMFMSCIYSIVCGFFRTDESPLPSLLVTGTDMNVVIIIPA